MIFTPFAFMAAPVTPGGFDSDYQAVLDYATTQGYTLPSAGQQTLQNQLVVDMKAAGISWSDLSIFYVMATDGDRDFAKINWANPGNFELTEYNTPTFTINAGFTGNGTNQALDTGFVPSTDWGTSTDVSMGGWADLDNNTGTIIGSFVTERTHLIHKWTSGDTFIALGGDPGSVGPETQTSGLWVVDNNGSNTNRLYVNNSLIDSKAIVTFGWSTIELSIMARKRSNTPTYDGWGSSDYKMAFYGTRDVGQNIYTPFNTYIDSLSSYLLDDYPGAVGAYSLRRLSSTYTGNIIEVQRSGDNATSFFGLSGDTLDTASLEAWVQAGGGTQDGFVKTWLDQSGNLNNQVQPNVNNMPAIVNAGSTIIQGSKPAIDFNGTNDYFSRSNIINVNANKTTFNVYYPQTFTTATPIMDLSSTTGTGQSWNLTPETALRCFGRTYVTTAGSTNTYSLLEMWQDGITIDDANQFKMYLNGNYEARTSGTAGDVASGTNNFTIGYSANGARYFDGTQQEIVIYPSALSDANREGVRDNINTYYSVY